MRKHYRDNTNRGLDIRVVVFLAIFYYFSNVLCSVIFIFDDFMHEIKSHDHNCCNTLPVCGSGRRINSAILLYPEEFSASRSALRSQSAKNSSSLTALCLRLDPDFIYFTWSLFSTPDFLRWDRMSWTLTIPTNMKRIGEERWFRRICFVVVRYVFEQCVICLCQP